MDYRVDGADAKEDASRGFLPRVDFAFFG